MEHYATVETSALCIVASAMQSDVHEVNEKEECCGGERFQKGDGKMVKGPGMMSTLPGRLGRAQGALSCNIAMAQARS